MSPESMKFAVEKITSTGNQNFMITDEELNLDIKI